MLNRLLATKEVGASVDIAILGCSKGAEVYSISYSIRSVRPDLVIRIRALDIDRDVVEFARGGTYSLRTQLPGGPTCKRGDPDDDLAARTFGDQSTYVFERMTEAEIGSMFVCDGQRASVRPQFREGISWHVGDAADPGLAESLGLQDILIANCFLCHMQPENAEICLHNMARLVKPNGYMFVSGVDLGVRSKVARALGWMPETDLLREIHGGDPSLRRDWPLQYWGLEPFDESRQDQTLRYASVFRIRAESPEMKSNHLTMSNPEGFVVQ